MSDWPMIQCPPGPSDAELEAERDAKHAVDVREWFAVEARRAVAAAFAVPMVAVAAIGGVGSAHAAPPIVGGQGLCPNAWALAEYVRSTYPGVLSIGGVRPCDAIGEHCAGHALDLMVGGNTALGNTIAADIRSQSGRFGVRYLLWQSDYAHRDHVHVTVN